MSDTNDAPAAAIAGTLPVIFSVPAEIADKGLYAAVFGLIAGTNTQVFLGSAGVSLGNLAIPTAQLSATVTLPSSQIVIASSASFPASNGNLLLTQTDEYGNITAQTSVTYTTYDATSNVFDGVSGGTGSFTASGTQVTLALDWIEVNTLAVGATLPLLNLFPNLGTYVGTAVTVINLPAPGAANNILSGELVMFVGTNSGLQTNTSQELSVPTPGSNPNDTFGLFEWGLSGALTPNSGGFIDYDVSAIDQVGFPFQVTALISNAPGAPTAPPPPFDQGVGFLQDRATLFNGFTPYLLSLPASSNAGPFVSLAPENSLAATRIIAPQDYLDLVAADVPQFPTSPAGSSSLQPIQNPAGTSSFTYGINSASLVVQIAGSGYASAPTVTFSAPPSGGTTATGTASLTSAGGIAGITVTDAGSGYTSSPTISFSGGGGTGASAAVGLAPATYYYAITALRLGVTVTDGGSGYTSAPAVSFTPAPGGGTTAAGTAVLGSGAAAGQVVGVYVTEAGSGYATAPSVTFSGGAGTGAAATVGFVETMAGPAQQAQINQGTVAVLDWLPFPTATAYNIYRSPNADLSAATLLNGATPFSPAALPAGTTLAAVPSGTQVTISPLAPTDTPAAGTLAIVQGGNQSFFQYITAPTTTPSSSTNPTPSTTVFTGTMVGSTAFTAGASVTLLPSYLDDGGTGIAAAPPTSDPLGSYFNAAIQDFFDYYRENTFSIDLSGLVSTRWTGNTQDITIDGNSYPVLQLTGASGTYGDTYTGCIANIYQPFFASNTDASAFSPPITLPPVPSWLPDPAESPAAMVFGADGVFGVPDNTNLPQATLAAGSLTLGAATLTCTGSVTAFPPAGQLQITGPGNTPQTVSYTSIGGDSFNGVTGGSGTFTSAIVQPYSATTPYSTAPDFIVKDILNPINAAINRGLTPRASGQTWTNVLSPDYWSQAALFPLTATPSTQGGGTLMAGTYYYAITGVNVNGDTSGQETIPGNVVTVPASAFQASNNAVALTIPNTGVTSFSQYNIYRGTSPDSLAKIQTCVPIANAPTSFVDTGFSDGTTAPPFVMNAPGQAVNWYAAYLHQFDVSINGLAYGMPYDDQGGFSTNVNLNYAGATSQPPQQLQITLLPWTPAG